MRKRRRLVAQQAVEPDLPCRAGEQIRAAHNLADRHHAVIHHDRKLISMNTISTTQHKITSRLLKVIAHTADAQIIEADRRNIRQEAQAQASSSPRCFASGAFLGA